MLVSCDSNKDVGEMEYELFRSKPKPLVDRALIPSIIEGSSSGEHPHHAVAIGLTPERSIQERREGISKIKNVSQLDSQAGRNTKAPTIGIRQAQHFASVLAPQPLSGPNLKSASAKTEASPDSTPSEARKVEPLEKPLAKITANPSRDHTLKLTCIRCGATTPPSGRWFYCPGCLGGALKCAACGTEKVRGVYTCASCHGEFK